MEDDLDTVSYISCGEILVAHSLSNKEEYFLKCNNCDEGFSLLEDFITHHQYYHSDVKSELDEDDMGNIPQIEIYDGDIIKVDKEEDIVHEKVEYLDDQDSEFGEQDVDYKPDACQIKEQCKEEDIEICEDNIGEVSDDEKFDFEHSEYQDDVHKESDEEKNEPQEDDIDTAADDDEDPLDEPMLHDGEDDKADDGLDDGEDNTSQTYALDDNAGYSDSDGEFEPPEDSKSRQFVSEFLKSERNFIAFVAAYKNQPRLWNHKIYSKKFKSKKERDSFLQKVANEIKSRLNIHMTCDNVSGIIKRIRQDYREKLKRSRPEDHDHKAPRTTNSRLSFLDPFIDYYSIVKLDTHRGYLKNDQILDILCIYKRYPALWNSTLMEYVCTNKRTEALKQMTEAIRTEVGIEVNESALKKYLMGVHSHYSKEKQNHMLKKGGTKSIYFPHMRFLHEHVGPFCCSKCGRKHRNPLQFKVHQYHNHGGPPPLKCAECNKEYEQLEPYVAHIRRHMNDLSDKCKVCGKMFMRAADVRIHMRTHTGAKPYFCEICGSSFTMPSSLKEHKRRHDKLYKVFCEVCSRGFYSNDKLVAHMGTHSDERNFACNTCGKAFKTKKTLRAHIHTHEEGRNYPCPQCGKMYKNRIGVSQHLRTHRSTAITKSNPFLSN
ncbi:zinc finger protein 181 [Stomoxys calcitrans]|uniref:zinc finger protein 181 n=1 Tax=Stomoxys calcitrans TaxID=35570 RepID=UPI0027E3110E|nr:zinc finger protein 181 [Stomoxys calcitrans]